MNMDAEILAEIQRRARAGAEKLDADQPNWFQLIDIDALDLSNCSSCVLGQLRRTLRQESVGVYGQESYNSMYGFDLADDRMWEAAGGLWGGQGGRQAQWDTLREAWVSEIKLRFDAGFDLGDE